MQFDDVFDDAKAAYAEVAGKSDEPLPDARSAGAEGAPIAPKGEAEAAKPGADASKREIPRVNGKFASRTAPAKAEADEKAPEAQEGEDEQAATGEAEGSEALSATKAVSPPPSWSVKSKAAWDALPDHIRADIAKRETEVGQGLAALKDYKDLKPFADMAAKHNTTISAALMHYTGIENVLRKDLGQGIALILQNYGMNQQQAGQFFATLAQKYGGQAPAANNNGAVPGAKPGDPLYDILKPYLDPVLQRNQQLEQKFTSREQADRNASEQSLAKAIETFSSNPANRFYPDLEESITRLFETGYVPLTGNHEADLRAAYDLAAQMNPDVREALIEQRLAGQKDAQRKKEQEVADKAKQASRSITGARASGLVSRQTEQVAGGHDDIEADVRNAYRLLAQR